MTGRQLTLADAHIRRRIDFLRLYEADRPCGHRETFHAECAECFAAIVRADEGECSR